MYLSSKQNQFASYQKISNFTTKTLNSYNKQQLLYCDNFNALVIIYGSCFGLGD